MTRDQDALHPTADRVNVNISRPQRRALADHRQDGKRFIPPLLQHLQLAEVSWTRDLLPEVLWLAVLTESYGLARGAALALSVSIAAAGAEGGQSDLLPCFTSFYASLEDESRVRIVESLGSTSDLDDIRVSLRNLLGLYPECPLGFLLGTEVPQLEDPAQATAQIKGLIAQLLDRESQAATFAQANAIYVAFVVGGLVVAEGLALANFPAIAEYPNTEESERVASSTRAALNTFAAKPPGGAWTRHFWNRGLELEGCEFGVADS